MDIYLPGNKKLRSFSLAVTGCTCIKNYADFLISAIADPIIANTPPVINAHIPIPAVVSSVL